MFKVLWLLKPAPGVSRERFREWYEHSHVPLAQRHFGHLLLEYRRNYVDEIIGTVPSDHVAGVDPMVRESAIAQAAGFEYAVVAEWVMRDEAAFDEVMSIFMDPQIGPTFRADSDGTMHPDTVLIKVSTCESSPPAAAVAEGLT